ncbi:MAG: hypothetical protein K1X57_08285 [Gemmataceae bacterium]|nr:hypothetical protein [Gemmataceae bacterium]
MSDDYLMLTVKSRPGEPEAEFKSRLSAFWTGQLRSHPDEFEKVYAETVEFENEAGVLTRQYLFEASVAALLEKELRAGEVDFSPLDRDDVYSKYEAAPPDWMWIEH